MPLDMKDRCQTCDAGLAHDGEAYICSHECTFCAACTSATDGVCPNCSGELLRRPRRVLPEGGGAT